MHKFLANLFFLLFATQIASAQTTDKTEFRLKAEKDIVAVGDIFTVKVGIKDFKDIIGFQWGLGWKLEDYELVSVEGSSNLFPKSTYNTSIKGIFRISWVDQTLSGEKIPDNDALLTLTYIAKKVEKLRVFVFPKMPCLLKSYKVLMLRLSKQILSAWIADLIGLKWQME